MQEGIYRKFLSNPLSLIGLGIVSLSILVAILGYWISPDNTPNANRMHIQLSIKKPGSKFLFLLIRKKEPIVALNLFQKLISGQPSFYEEIPINSYQFKGDSIFLNEYTGVLSDSLQKSSYHLVDVVYARKDNILKQGSRYYFLDIRGK